MKNLHNSTLLSCYKDFPILNESIRQRYYIINSNLSSQANYNYINTIKKNEEKGKKKTP